MRVNVADRQIECKLVFCGPGLGGKTTNVQQLAACIPPKQRGDLTALPTVGERTLFFEYMPLDLGTINGFKLKMKLFTVPGQIFYLRLQTHVLRDADGLIFVADRAPGRQDANLVAMHDVFDLMDLTGKALKPTTPMVIQYNKRDLPNAVPIPELEQTLNPWGVPAFAAVASQGINVLETLKALSKQIAYKIQRDGPK